MASDLSALLKRASLNDHEELLNAADAALERSKDDVTAQQVRLVALIKLDRYREARATAEKGGDALRSKATLEWAYSLYRTHSQAEAGRILVENGSQTRASLLLEAQTAYRTEDFARAADIYKALEDGGGADDDEETDLRINRGAVDAQRAWIGFGRGIKPKVTSADLERFDVAFNAACGAIARGDFKQAEFLLGRAKALCAADEELSEADKRDELLSIEAQQIYVFIVLEKKDEAKALCKSLRVDDISDAETRKIARSNERLLDGPASNPYLAQRLFNAGMDAETTEQPFQFQRSLLEQNGFALGLSANKTGAIANAARANAALEKTLDNAWIGVFDAAAHAHGQVGKEAIKAILPILERRSHDVGLVLTIVQLYVLTNNTQTATFLLERFLDRLEASSGDANQDVRFAPGLVTVLATLYANQNRIGSAKTELVKAARHWRHRRKDTAAIMPLLQATGAALLEMSSEEDVNFAHELFTAIAREDVADPITAAGLVASQPEGRRIDSSNLPAIAQMTDGIDVEALEEAGIARPAAKAVPTQPAKRPAESAGKQAKNKRIRNSRMPKDYDESKKPDPERWLPLRDRSYWRPKGKKKNKSQGGGGGTQGGLAEEASKGPAAHGTVQQKAGGTSNKKKKKGKGGK